MAVQCMYVQLPLETLLSPCLVSVSRPCYFSAISGICYQANMSIVWQKRGLGLGRSQQLESWETVRHVFGILINNGLISANDFGIGFAQTGLKMPRTKREHTNREISASWKDMRNQCPERNFVTFDKLDIIYIFAWVNGIAKGFKIQYDFRSRKVLICIAGMLDKFGAIFCHLRFLGLWYLWQDFGHLIDDDFAMQPMKAYTINTKSTEDARWMITLSFLYFSFQRKWARLTRTRSPARAGRARCPKWCSRT